MQHLPSAAGLFTHAVNAAPEHTSADSDHSEWLQSGNADGASYIEGTGNGGCQYNDNGEASAEYYHCYYSHGLVVRGLQFELIAGYKQGGWRQQEGPMRMRQRWSIT